MNLIWRGQRLSTFFSSDDDMCNNVRQPRPTVRPIKARPASHRKIFLQSGTNFLILPCECFRAGPKEIRREQRRQHRSAGVFACEFPHRPGAGTGIARRVNRSSRRRGVARTRSRDGCATRFRQPQSARSWISFSWCSTAFKEGWRHLFRHLPAGGYAAKGGPASIQTRARHHPSAGAGRQTPADLARAGGIVSLVFQPC